MAGLDLDPVAGLPLSHVILICDAIPKTLPVVAAFCRHLQMERAMGTPETINEWIEAHAQWLKARERQTELLRAVLEESCSDADAFNEAKKNLEAARQRVSVAARRL